VTGERLLPGNAPKTITQGDPVEAFLPATADPDPLNVKGGVITTFKARPVMGTLVYANQSPPGKTRVACDQAHSGRMGVVSHDRSARANPDVYGLRVVRNTYPKASTP
jgi:hypothetical protein